MPQPLSFPPLIPLPDDTQGPPNEDKDDIFSTLFSPPTPRASPTPAGVHTSSSPVLRAPRHTRSDSTDSEFGAFVSVSSTEDPLRSAGLDDDDTPMTPLQNVNFFDRFAQDAKAAAEKNKRGVLDELLEHQDDPLYWVQPSGSASDSGAATPMGASEHEHPVQDNRATEQDSYDTHDELLVDIEPARPSSSPPHSRHSVREHTAIDPGRSSHASTLARSPSLPPSSPSRLAEPELQRTQSYFTPVSLPSRLVSTLLSTAASAASAASGRPPVTRPRSHTHEGEPLPAQQHQASLPAALPSQLLETVQHIRSQTAGAALPASMSVDSAITHGSPFASQPFVPATGAPGFVGDRTWDKGFQFDRMDVEKRAVRLVGRREVTVPVLTEELADMLRPHFPALARLPRSWSLLYSLDQHGISLNTLYTRCQSHTGGAVVVMRDSGDAVFGVWLGEGVHQSRGGYYGGGSSFMWRLLPDKRLRIYKWTGKNDYVALCETEYLSFGGGDGHYGLYLDSSLTDGSSAWCPTFDNEPLCSAGPRQGDNVTFECVALEVWGVG
ncbi:hypothetical protein CERSUDRAFT_108566 [Gelatoporia subvermispora B]|uniref:Oxidation resistance protein 1 n=1 Tax=Ceriporiopsis subvermispora (strain B) TaxID=914234 RepID=M2Q7A7_CERS8|nr:hypothetical protein CERSUDRAFT_108566 [Gelatoporia subvermispora B]